MSWNYRVAKKIVNMSVGIVRLRKARAVIAKAKGGYR